MDIQEQIATLETQLKERRAQRANIDALIDTDERELKRLRSVISRELYGVGRGDSLVVTDAVYRELQSRGVGMGFSPNDWATGSLAVCESDGAGGSYSVWCNGGVTVITAELVKGMREEFLTRFG